jgi:hypothetical protein
MGEYPMKKWWGGLGMSLVKYSIIKAEARGILFGLGYYTISVLHS